MNTTHDTEKILQVTEVAIQHNNRPAICVKVNMPLKRCEFEIIRDILREDFPHAIHLFFTYQELEICSDENDISCSQSSKPV